MWWHTDPHASKIIEMINFLYFISYWRNGWPFYKYKLKEKKGKQGFPSWFTTATARNNTDGINQDPTGCSLCCIVFLKTLIHESMIGFKGHLWLIFPNIILLCQKKWGSRAWALAHTLNGYIWGGSYIMGKSNMHPLTSGLAQSSPKLDQQ